MGCFFTELSGVNLPVFPCHVIPSFQVKILRIIGSPEGPGHPTCRVVHSPVGCCVTPRMRMSPGCVFYYGQDTSLGAVEQVTVKKSLARIASAWECRNCDQAGAVRRGAG